MKRSVSKKKGKDRMNNNNNKSSSFDQHETNNGNVTVPPYDQYEKEEGFNGINEACCESNNAKISGNNDSIKKKNKKNKKKLKKNNNNPYRLLSFAELPEYMKDNEFILSHYRADWPIKRAFLSLFTMHNETLNVWTHLIGFVLFVGLTLANIKDVPNMPHFLARFTWSFPLSTINTNFTKDMFVGTTKLLDLDSFSSIDHHLASSQAHFPVATRWPFFVFLAGSMFCLLSSSVCHLFCCHSHKLNLLLLQLDYAGIAVMIITSFFPPIYYIFQCEPYWQFIYLSGITSMGIFTIITLLSPSLSTPKYRSFRALLFASMGLFGIVPAVHALSVNWANPRCAVTLLYESAMAVSYLTGTMFYVTRIPERWKPGWFDLAGHSHQIFHVFVIMGALAHYAAAIVFLEYRDHVGCDRIA